MAARLTERQKQKIIEDYVQLGNYSEVGRMNNCAPNTVKKLVHENAGVAELYEQKKMEATESILEYMDARRDVICEIIGKCLDVLNDEDKLAAATPNQITTALGTLIDKWTGMQELLKKGEQQGVVIIPEVKEDV